MIRRDLMIFLAVAVTILASIVLLTGEGSRASSSLSREARGLWLARTWLESRGAEVHLLEAPLEQARQGGVLVLALPLQRVLNREDWLSLDRHLRHGGTLLVAYSGQLLDPAEIAFVEAFGLERVELREEVPYAPTKWRAYQREVWRLRPTEEWPEGPELAVGAFAMAPSAPAAAQVLYRRGEGDAPLVFSWHRFGGRVVVLPAELLVNGRLLEAGNGDLLESLLSWLGPVWTFDEFHHGWVDQTVVEQTSHFAWDLFIAHLVLIYLLALVAFGWRFGPSWRAAPVRSGSTDGFLKNLGALHHQLGHHREAAELLVERWNTLDMGRTPSDSDAPGQGEIEHVADGPRLVALARQLTAAGRGRGQELLRTRRMT